MHGLETWGIEVQIANKHLKQSNQHQQTHQPFIMVPATLSRLAFG